MKKVPESVVRAFTARFDLNGGEVSYLGGGQESSDGVTYACKSPEGQRVLKIMSLPDSSSLHLHRFEERLRFVFFLSQGGVNIVYPIPMNDGALYAIEQAGEEHFVAYMMPFANGIHPRQEDFQPPFYYNYGKTIGRLHRVTQQYPDVSTTSTATGELLFGWEQEWQSFYDWCKDGEVKDKWLSIRERLQPLPVYRDCYGFIHNDPHASNLFLDGDRVTLIDFDVANYHWFINDITITMMPLVFYATGGMDRPCKDRKILQSFLEHFLRGYETENHLDQSWLDTIDLFMAYRRILLFTAMQDWLSKQPERYARWKNMIMTEPAVLGPNQKAAGA